MNKRQFIKGSLGLAGASALPLGKLFAKADSSLVKPELQPQGFDFHSAALTIKDEISLSQDFQYNAIASMGDKINANGDVFGDCCDYLKFLPGKEEGRGFLWVNHEYLVDHLLYGRRVSHKDKTKAMIETELKTVGGSFIELRRKNHSWQLNPESRTAFRIDASTPMPIVGPWEKKEVKGTLANCSGGYTPWGTILTCEENFEQFYDKDFPGYIGWAKYDPQPLENYGWVVEVDLKTQGRKVRKLSGLGRFAHEGALVVGEVGEHARVYMGDDKRFECLYKFVSKRKITGDAAKDGDLLVEGTLHVADFKNARWVGLTMDHPELKGHFKNQGEIMVHTRKAAKLVGGTPLNRPEGIDMHPKTGDLYMTLTNNSAAGDFYGSILRVSEKSGDEFSFSAFAVGGHDLGFACPDNLAFASDGSLWVGTDISGTSMGRGAYEKFPRNKLIRLDDDGGNMRSRTLLYAPPDAEVTGLAFSDGFDDLFCCIQHAGETSFYSQDGYTSHWPNGGNKRPLSTVIGISRKDRLALVN